MEFPRKLWLWGLLALFFLLPFWPGVAWSEENQGKVSRPGKRAILILMDRVNWQDVMAARTPHIRELARRGGVGLLNPQTAGTSSTPNAYLTIGAGKRALASEEGGLAFGWNEVFNDFRAQAVYQGRTGQIPGPDNLFHLGIAQLTRKNSETNYNATAGALGEALKAGGLSAAVLGNSDTADGYGRFAVMIAMDSLGLVAGGKTDSVFLTTDQERPFGWRTNYDFLLQETLRQLPRYNLVVVETGDTYRVEAYRNQLTGEQLDRQRRLAIEGVDEFIGRLVRSVDLEETRIILLTPAPPSKGMKAGDYLTPVIMAGGGVARGSLLTTDTTRRQGLLTLTDIAPALLEYFGLPPSPDMNGGRVTWVLAGNNLEEVLALNRELVTDYNNRLWVLLSVVGLQIIALLFLGASLFLPSFPLKLPLRGCRLILLGAVFTPLSILFLGILKVSSLWLQIGIIFALDFLLAGLISLVVSREDFRVFLACLLTALGIMADILSGSRLMQNSPLGYDVIIGARYYGIGNEYMGILVAAVLLGAIPWNGSPGRGPLSRLILLGYYLLATLFLGSPLLGANLGGAITAVAAFGLAFLQVTGNKVSWRQIAFLLASPLGVATVFIFLDLAFNPHHPSHLARTAQALLEGGLPELGRIIVRKAAMNWQLMRIMGGFPVLLPVGALLAWVLYWSRPTLDRWARAQPALAAAIRGTLFGSLVALVFNDSGIIAAGGMLLYLFPVILYIHLAKKEARSWNTASLAIQG